MRRLFFLFFISLCPLMAQEGEAPPPEYPIVDERFLEELRKQDEKKEVIGESRFYQEFLYMLLVLGMIVGTLILISWALKKMMHSRVQQMNVTNLIKVLERRDLSQKSSLYLIEITGQGYLVAESPQGLSPLGEVDLESSDSSFSSLMDQKEGS